MSDEPTPEVTETPAPEADPTPESQDEPGKSLSPAEVEALISKFKKEKSAANREAQAVKKRLEEFEKAEAERKQAEMSELEKLQAKVQEAQAALAEKDAAIAQAKREAAARDAGVDPAYVDYAASAYAKDPDNPDFFLGRVQEVPSCHVRRERGSSGVGWRWTVYHRNKQQSGRTERHQGKNLTASDEQRKRQG